MNVGDFHSHEVGDAKRKSSSINKKRFTTMCRNDFPGRDVFNKHKGSRF